MKIQEYLNEELLEKHLEDGIVALRPHDVFPLIILSYSKKCVREQVWDEVTTRCRGLIVNTLTDEIIARPFEKFFDYGDHDHPETLKENLPTSLPIVQEKLNGSLGILFNHRGEDYIASKGSFHSPFADWANKWYKKNVTHPVWPEGYTPVFEMICESVDTHVVDYKGQERLVLLALINIETGEEADYNTLYHWARINGLDVANIYGKTLDEVSKETLLGKWQNLEGYVLSWPRPGKPPIKVRLKYVEYMRMRRIVRFVKPEHILDAYFDNRAQFDDWTTNYTPAFAAYVMKWFNAFAEKEIELHNKVDVILMQADKTFGEYKPADRVYWALFFNGGCRKQYAKLLFPRLDKDELAYDRALQSMLLPLTQEDNIGT